MFERKFKLFKTLEKFWFFGLSADFLNLLVFFFVISALILSDNIVTVLKHGGLYVLWHLTLVVYVFFFFLR